MTDERSQAEQEALNRAAALFARALEEMQRAGAAGNTPIRQELAHSSATLAQLAQRMEQQLADDKEQRHVLAGQLTTLAGSLESLVTHLQGLSQLMGDILERLAEPPPRPEPGEPSFPAGGEGMSLTLTGVPGFTALMELQKALTGMEQVAGVSVERFQDNDARVLVHLREAITGTELSEGLRRGTNQAFVIEESRPELLRLRLKHVPH